MSALTVGLEPSWKGFWPRAQALMEQHHRELAVPFPLAPDHEAIEALLVQGWAWLLSATSQQTLLGYSAWYLTPNLESRGQLLAQQGPWYSAPGNARIALALWQASLAQAKARGAWALLPHHWHAGRGSDLGQFFRRQGAKPLETTYYLELG